MTMPKTITELYAWIVTERSGEEGLPAMEVVIDGQAVFTPIIGADLARIQSMREHAVRIKAETGLPMRLCRFVLTDDDLDRL